MGKNSTWKDEEELYLAENWGKVSINTICKKLDRSKNAVLIKKGRMGLGAFLDSGEYVTVNKFFIEFGFANCNSYCDISWVKNRNFPIKYKKVGACNFKVIYIDDFWKWAENNRHFVPFERLEANVFGKEPDWVDGVRRSKVKSAIRYKKTPWTKSEDSRLKYLLKQNKFGYAELSRLLMRTEGAITRRCIDLKIKERPIKADNHNKWVTVEIDAVFSLIKQGYTYELISEQLNNRSVKSLRGLLYRLFGTENIDSVYRQIIEKETTE